MTRSGGPNVLSQWDTSYYQDGDVWKRGEHAGRCYDMEARCPTSMTERTQETGQTCTFPFRPQQGKNLYNECAIDVHICPLPLFLPLCIILNTIVMY